MRYVNLFLLAFLLVACDSVVSFDEIEIEAPIREAVTTTSQEVSGKLVYWGADLIPEDPSYSELPSFLHNNDFVTISVGYQHNAGVRKTGAGVTWGYEGLGRYTGTIGSGLVDVSAGDHHTLGLREDGSILAVGITDAPWSDVEYGQVSDTPDGEFIAISAFGFHSLAVRTDGTIEGWGAPWYLGLPPTGDGFVSVDAWGNYALHQDGHIVTWTGSLPDYLEGDDFIEIKGGVGLRSDGTIAHPEAPSGNGFIAVDRGIALHGDGYIEVWGSDNYGQISDVPTGYNFIDVASNGWHMLAVQATRIIAQINVPHGILNVRSNGSSPVAILSDNGLDAPNDIDRESLTFGATGKETSLFMRGNGPHCSVEDANNNGTNDLVCRFRMGDTGLSESYTEAVLMGQTIDGIDIEGRTEVDVRRPGSNRPSVAPGNAR